MEVFLRRILIFIILPLVYFAVNTSINYLIYSKHKVDIGSPEIIVFGDSHPMTGINTNIINNAINIARSGEPYVLTYWKMKEILKYHVPKTIILGFSPHNISEFNDLKFSDPAWSTEMFKRSYTIHQFDDIRELIPFNSTDYYKTIWKETAFYPKRNHINYLGQFSENRTTSNISNWEDRVKRHFYNDEQRFGVSKIAIMYLDSIVTLANSHNIETILVGVPVHEKYYQNIPSEFILEYENLKHVYSERSMVIDYLQVFSLPDSMFFDANHLNIKGATKFTIHLQNKVNSIKNRNELIE